MAGDRSGDVIFAVGLALFLLAVLGPLVEAMVRRG